MANRYWVGGTGAWDGSNTTNWSASSGGAGGASVPTSADNVIFDNGSDAGANYAVTISGTRACANFTVSSQDFVTTMSGTATPVLQIHGSVNVNPVTSGRYVGTGDIAMQFLGSGSLTISVTNTSPANQLTAGSCTFNNSGGTWTLNSGFNVSTSVTLTAGTLSLSTHQLTVTSGPVSVNGGSLNFSSGTLATGASTCTFAAGTVTAGTGNLSMNIGSSNRTLVGGGNTFYQVTLGTALAQSIAITGANTFTNLIFGGSAAANRTVTLSANQTVTGDLNFGGGSATNPHLNRTLITSDTIGTARTISIGTAQNVSNLDFRDITITGAASPISGSSIGNKLGNSGITFTAAKASYWVGGTGNWNSNADTRWAASSGGAAAAANYPLAQDTAIVDSSSGSGTLTVEGTLPDIFTLDMSARTTAFTVAIPSNMFVYGSWKNGSGITLSDSGTIYFYNRAAATILSSGKSFPQVIRIESRNSSVALLDNFSCTVATYSPTVLATATFNMAGFDCSVGSIQVAGGGNLAIGSGTLTVSGSGTSFIVNPSSTSVTGSGKISMTSASSKAFAGGFKTYGHLENAGAGALTVNSQNTFTTISNSVQPTTFTFPSGSTVTVTNFNVSGTPGNLVTINATSTGNATLSKASGAVVVSYCSITKSTATGGATWSALVADGNVNAGSNSGWNFGVSSNGLFFGSNF